MNDRNRVSVLH